MDTASCISLDHGVQLWLKQGDLTLEAVDAIVNAANEHLAHGGGLAAAIVRRGGPAIQAESHAWVAQHGPASHDRPALTSGGALLARYVIHAVGPRWGEGDEDAKLSTAVAASLALASQLELNSLALPAISTGIFGFPTDRAAGIILDAIHEYIREHPASSLTDVRLVVFDAESLRHFTAALKARPLWGPLPT